MYRWKITATYFVTYFFIFLLFISTMIPLGYAAQSNSRDRIIRENQLRIDNGVQRIENETNKYVQLSSFLCMNQDLLHLAFYKTDDAASAGNVTYMLRVKNQIKYLLSVLDGVDNCLIAFERNPIYLSKTMVAQDYRDVYGQFFWVGDYSGDAFHKLMLSDMQAIHCLPEQTIKMDHLSGSKPMLTFITRGMVNMNTASNCAIAYFIQGESFLNTVMPNNDSDSFTLLVNSRGERLLSTELPSSLPELLIAGNRDTVEINEEKYMVFRAESAQLGMTLFYGIPESRITESTHLLMRYILIYIVAGILLAAVLCVLYAAWHAKSVRQMVSEGMVLSEIPFQNTNGYHYIRQVLSQISDEKDKVTKDYTLLDHAYLENMLSSACTHGVYSQKEIQTLQHYVGELPLYCVAVIKYSEPMDAAAQLSIEQKLEKLLPVESLIAVHQKPQKSILIISGEKEKGQIAALAMEALQKLLSPYDSCSAGISDVLSGVEMLHLGYQQAHQALRKQQFSGIQSVSCYQVEDNDAILMDIAMMNKLNDLVFSGKKDGLNAFFHEQRQLLVHNAGLSEEQFLELYYSLRLVLQNIARELKIDLSIPAYRGEASYIEAVNHLEESGQALIEQIETRQKRSGEELYEKIVRVMNENLSDTALNSSKVSQLVGCSEKYVYRLCKEWSGKSFGDQLEALRIAKTEILLETTKMSNEQIANEAGFASLTTFYRSFKKVHGVTPSVWRTSQGKQEQ